MLRQAMAQRALEEENEALRRELNEAKVAGQEAIAELARRLEAEERQLSLGSSTDSPIDGHGGRAQITSHALPSLSLHWSEGKDFYSSDHRSSLKSLHASLGIDRFASSATGRMSRASLMRTALATAHESDMLPRTQVHAQPSWRSVLGEVRSAPSARARRASWSATSSPRGDVHVESIGSNIPGTPNSARSARPGPWGGDRPPHGPARALRTESGMIFPSPYLQPLMYTSSPKLEATRSSPRLPFTHPSSGGRGSRLFLLDGSPGSPLVSLPDGSCDPRFELRSSDGYHSSPRKLDRVAWASLGATPPIGPRGSGRQGPSPRTKREFLQAESSASSLPRLSKAYGT